MQTIDVNYLSNLSTEELKKLELNLKGYDEEPVDIEKFIFDKRYLGNYFHGAEFSPHWLEFLNKLYEKKIEAPAFLIFLRGCLGADTKIPILDGRTLTIKDIAIEFKNGNRNMKVLSYNIQRKCYEPDLITCAFSTGVKPVYRIHLDNGKFVDCTSNHKFLTRNNKWVSIDNGLKEKITSLLPYNAIEIDNYINIIDPFTGEATPRYRITAGWKFGRIPKGFQVHHKDLTKTNDSPENLCVLSFKEHFGYHSRKEGKERCQKGNDALWNSPNCKWSRIQHRESLRNHMLNSDQPKMMFQALKNNEEAYKKHLERSSKQMIDYNKSERGRAESKNRAQHMRNILSTYDDEQMRVVNLKRRLSPIIHFHGINSNEFHELMEEIHKSDLLYVPPIAGDKNKTVTYRGKDYKLDKFKSKKLRDIKKEFSEDSEEYIEALNIIRENCPEYNHSVVKIEYLGEQEVFDITTENNHNFTLSAGIISHNSIGRGKSTSACIGTLYDQYLMMCLKSPQEYFGLVSSEQIVLFVMNVTLGLSEQVIMGKINSMISQSPYFSEKARIAKDNKDIKTRFPKGIDIRSGSRVSHTLGQAIHCLSEDTIIPIYRGVKLHPLFISIKEIHDRIKNNINTLAFSYDIQKKERLIQPIVNAFDNGIENVYKIDLSNHRSFECTMNHRMLTSNLEYKHLSELKIGDRLKSGYENDKNGIEIIDITPVGKKRVYDIEIHDTHNFLLESGVYSHNSAILSEAAFSIYDNQFIEAFNSILARQQSRFMREGKASGRIWVDSSEKDTGSILNELCDRYRDKPGVIVDSGPLWEIRPWNYGTDEEDNRCGFFYVYKGSDREPASIVNMNDLKQITRLSNDEPNSILVVPESHRNAFEADIDMSLRDLGGIATASMYRLFRNMKMLLNAFQGMPLYDDVIELDFYDQSDQIIDHCKLPQYFDNLPSPNAMRFIHVDIGLSGDKLGFAMSYISGKKDVEVLKDITNINGEKTVDSAITTITELAFSIKNKAGQQVPLNKIRIFVKWLIDKGVVIGGVSSDSFQSASMLQEMKLLGLESTVISVDKTVDPYINLRNAIYEGRCILPANALLRKELENLLVAPDGSKVDHPDVFPGGTERGSKDVSDAVCAAVYNCFKNQDKYNIFEILSSPQVGDMILSSDPVFDQFVNKVEVKNNNPVINDILSQWSDIKDVNDIKNDDPYLDYLKSLNDLNKL